MRATQMKNFLKILMGVFLVLGVCVAQSAIANSDKPFTNASLRGSYAYINSTSDVASLGPIIFDGNGNLSTELIVNLPCPGASPAPNCSRTVNDIPRAEGTYSVERNGTGVATINFSTGTVEYNFIITESKQKGTILLATNVFAAGKNGGLAGQLTAPLWSRVSD